MHTEEAQTQPQAAHALHHAAAQRAREEVPREAVPLHRGARRVQRAAEADGDPGEDLVPEPARQDQAAAGVGAGAPEVRLGAADAAPLRHPAVSVAGGPQLCCRLQPAPGLASSLHARQRPALLPLVTSSAQCGDSGGKYEVRLQAAGCSCVLLWKLTKICKNIGSFQPLSKNFHRSPEQYLRAAAPSQSPIYITRSAVQRRNAKDKIQHSR